MKHLPQGYYQIIKDNIHEVYVLRLVEATLPRAKLSWERAQGTLETEGETAGIVLEGCVRKALHETAPLVMEELKLRWTREAMEAGVKNIPETVEKIINSAITIWAMIEDEVVSCVCKHLR